MGNLFSQETDNVIVKVKPYYFTKSEDGYSQDKIKNFKITKNITLNKGDKNYLFNICNYKIKKTSFRSNELIFEIQYNKVLSCSNISYVIQVILLKKIS